MKLTLWGASIEIPPFNVPVFLVVTTSIGFFGLIAMLYKWPVSGDSKDILQVMLGSVGAGWIATMNYYFGSSSGSATKTAMLGQPTTSTTTTTPTAEVTTVTEPKKEGQ